MLNHYKPETKKQSRSSSLSQAALFNSLVQVDSTYEENEQFINELFLSTIVQGNLPDDELKIEQLWSIATQCLLQGGDAVFRARSIYRLFNPLIHFPDDSLCQSDSLEIRQPLKAEKQLPELTYRLFPNPSSGELPHISFSSPLKSPATVRFFRISGEEMTTLQLNTGFKSGLATNTPLRPGIYTCIITLSDGKRLPVERFIMVK